MAITETIDISEPDYPGESIPTVAGGRIWKQSPMEDGEITLEIYPIELDTTTGVGLAQHYVGGTWDTSEPLATFGTGASDYKPGVFYPRDKFRIAILWTNDPAATAAESTTAASTDSYRFWAMDCRIISHKTSFTDGIVKTTVTFKFAPTNKAGTTRNFAYDSGDQTALVALAAY